MKTTKTRTAVSVVLTVLAAGSILAGIYYYGNRNITSQAIGGCGCDDIRNIIKGEVAKINGGSRSGSGSSSSTSGSGSTSSTGEITGTCQLSLGNVNLLGGGYGVRTCSTNGVGAKVTEFVRCHMEVNAIAGEGCRTIAHDPLNNAEAPKTSDVIIDASVDKIDPGSYTQLGSGSRVVTEFWRADNVRNTCEKIAKDGYKCWALDINAGLTAASCACSKK